MKQDVLLLGGAYEFLPTSGEELSDKKRNALTEAFQIINYDLGIISPAEFQFLQKGPLGIPQNWINCKNFKIVTKPLKNGKKAAIIILPYLEKGSDHISDDLLSESAAIFKESRSKADIVIALSPWSYFREKRFLASPAIAETPPDLLLGSGDGPGMTGSLAANGKTLWVRSYPTGKAVSRIDILQFPARSPDFKWTSGKNIKWFLQTLLIKVREEPEVAKLLSGITDEKK
ncbi:conserved protein of unknown function [Maridesulfovibrio hydrothermalis AM13 = DSM 14728]|nr:hypothetical protein [Maridesulfovibrio hydrothermalis]CCO24267.1 conserved protein of unknown function [Maridesulfovibrio hydrothermalis AM13 = DSM 14728]